MDDTLREHLNVTMTMDPAGLESLGAELQAGGHTLPDVLAALPSTTVPVDAAAIAAGYLAAQSGSEADELGRVRAELERRRAELAALHRVNAVATSSLDEQTVLGKVVCAVAEVMGVDVCSIYLLQGPNQLVLGATCGLNPLAVGTARLLVGEGLTGWAAERAADGGGGQHLERRPRQVRARNPGGSVPLAALRADHRDRRRADPGRAQRADQGAAPVHAR